MEVSAWLLSKNIFSLQNRRNLSELKFSSWHILGSLLCEMLSIWIDASGLILGLFIKVLKFFRHIAKDNLNYHLSWYYKSRIIKALNLVSIKRENSLSMLRVNFIRQIRGWTTMKRPWCICPVALNTQVTDQVTDLPECLSTMEINVDSLY